MHMDGSCQKDKRVLSHMYMRRVKHMDESCNTYVWTERNARVSSYVTQRNESRLTRV